MKTGIVLNISDGNAQILLAGGKFQTVRAREGWQIGDLVLLKDRASWKLKLAAIGCAAIICVGLFGFFIVQKAAVISLDVNPSIEIVLNRLHRVIEIRALNEEGYECIRGLKIKYKNYIDAVTEILEQEKEYGYLENNPLIVLTVWAKKEKNENILLWELHRVVSDVMLQENLECYTIKEDILKAAKEYKVTAGKYIYVNKLKAANPNLSIEDNCNKSIIQLKEELEEYNTPDDDITILEPPIEPSIEPPPDLTPTPELWKDHHGSGHHVE